MSMVSSNSVAHCMCPVWPDVVIKSSPILQTVNKKVATTVCIDRCVGKYFEANAKVGSKLSGNPPPS